MKKKKKETNPINKWLNKQLNKSIINIKLSFADKFPKNKEEHLLRFIGDDEYTSCRYYVNKGFLTKSKRYTDLNLEFTTIQSIIFEELTKSKFIRFNNVNVIIKEPKILMTFGLNQIEGLISCSLHISVFRKASFLCTMTMMLNNRNITINKKVNTKIVKKFIGMNEKGIGVIFVEHIIRELNGSLF